MGQRSEPHHYLIFHEIRWGSLHSTHPTNIHSLKLLLDHFFDKLYEVRGFLRLAKLQGLLVGLVARLYSKRATRRSDWLKTPQKAFKRTSLAALARDLRLTGGFLAALAGLSAA